MKRSLATMLLLVALTGSAWAAISYEDAAAQFSAKKYTDARKSAEALAKTGDARAMAMLGAIYQNGLGTTPNEDEAIRWYSAAADKDQREAQFSLAMIYLDGKRGISHDRHRRSFAGESRRQRPSDRRLQSRDAADRRSDRYRRLAAYRRPLAHGGRSGIADCAI